MKIERFFTKPDVHPYEMIEWKRVDHQVKNHETGKLIFEIKNAEVPVHFSEQSYGILLSKYFRMAGVPKSVKKIEETHNGKEIPEWIRRSEPDNGVGDKDFFGYETSAKQVFDRIAGMWTYWGWVFGYFVTEEDAKIFNHEILFMLSNQLAAPNTPSWFNGGLWWAYGTEKKPRGFWRFDEKQNKAVQLDTIYKYPGIFACYIVGIEDSLFGENSIYDNISIEARGFSTGGGCGSNFSNIRAKGEKLSNGGTATGLMSFLKVFDRSAAVIKSGSGVRRASKMVIVDADHPEIMDFLEWKTKEEKKAIALINAGYDKSYEGEAYQTVSGQNSNNSITIPDELMSKIDSGGSWALTERTTGNVTKEIDAKEMWEKLINNAWETGDPAMQFIDTTNAWNTCRNDAEIRSTNPCSEFIWLDNTACNLASINLQRFFERDKLDVPAFRHACHLWTIALDINNELGSAPSRKIAENIHKYRAIGLGHTGLGAVFMKAGIPYDSKKACSIAAAVTGLMTAQAFITSSELAKQLSPFPRFEENKDCMLKVLNNMRLAAHGSEMEKKTYKDLNTKPKEINHYYLSSDLSQHLMEAFDAVIECGTQNGFRNAFVSLLAPTGTIGLVMGCDTLGIEPDFSLIKHKVLSGGGTMKIVNESLVGACRNLGYSDVEIEEIKTYVVGHGTIDGAPGINRKSLLEKGLTTDDVNQVDEACRHVTELRHALAIHNVNKGILGKLGISNKTKNFVKDLGFSLEEYIHATTWICGHGVVEGCSVVKKEHLAVFDCAVNSGFGRRVIAWEAHVEIISAVSPFLSGAVSKTVNCPKETSKSELSDVFKKAYEGGQKCIAIYRDGSKRSQPLNAMNNFGWWEPIAKKKQYKRGDRKRPPANRLGITSEVSIQSEQGHRNKVWIRTGEYDGVSVEDSLCEIWVDVNKENPNFYLAVKWWARAVSNALQYGQSLKDVASSYLLDQGGPSGKTDHPYIHYASSIPDLVFKILCLEYLGDTSFCRVPVDTAKLRCSQIEKHREASDFEWDLLFDGNGGNGGNGGRKNGRKSYPIVVQDEGYGQRDQCLSCGSYNLKNAGPCLCCESCGAMLGGCTV